MWKGIRSRTARRFDVFDRRFDKVVAPVLLGVGFAETEPYVFTRADPLGQDVVYFDILLQGEKNESPQVH
jgi:hypothetical protein